jgi:ArsR family transcriptional regulator, zinc-responsive transcriptional repressor
MINAYIGCVKTRTRGCGEGLSIEFLARTAQVLKLLAHPHRLKIVEILEAREAPVHEIVGQMALPQAACSQHLNQMRRVGLVAAARRGREVWYRIADRRSISILNCIRVKKAKCA